MVPWRMPVPRVLSPAVVLALLAGVAAVTWWPAFGCGFIWDDDDYVTQNPVLRSAAGLWQLWTEPVSLPQYYPLVHTTFWLEHRLWGLHPLGYHVVNVLLHTLCAFQLWRLCTQLGLRTALVPALWFLVHPVHVESVAWITERKNVLSLLCALVAARRWLAWHDDGRPRDLAVGSVAFAGALLAKTVTATVPAALLVVLWWRDGRIGRRAVRGVVPWLLVGALAAWFTVHLEATHVRAAGTPWQLAGADRALVAGRAPWFYLGCLLWPVGLCFNYERWRLDATALADWLWPLATVLCLAAAFRLRRRTGRGPLAVLLLFGGLLLPALGLFDVFPFRYAFVADHFQYHASVAVLVGGSAVVVPWLQARWPRPAVAGGLVGIGCLLVGLTWHAQGAYRDLETLWRRTLQQNERSTLALTNLGGLANLRGDFAAARPLFERALAIDATLHEAHNNLGVIAHQDGDRATARACYERALALRPDDPSSLNNLATLLLEEGRPRDALPRIERASAQDPTWLEGRMTLAWALHDGSQWERALAVCDEVLKRLPDHVPTRQRAVQCLSRLGRHRQAASNAMVLLRAQPQSTLARSQVAATLADVLRTEPVADARNLAENALRRSGLDPVGLLPHVADALRARGANAHADALGRR